METREATCACGQLRITVPRDPIRVSVCHCLACQRRTGAPFGQQARFAGDQVTTSGSAKEFRRAADEDGEGRTYSFCPECGSTVWYVLDDDTTDVAVPVGGFADPSFPPPRRSVWESRRHAWVQVPDGAERFD